MSLFLHPMFYLLRHGQTAHNAAGLIAGKTDAPVTGEGHRQAGAAARLWSGLAVGSVHVSPLLRARQTAAAFLRLRPDLTVTPAPLLAERNWGIWEGEPRAILDRGATPQGGEGPDPFRTRIAAACAAIPGPVPGEAPPLLIAHSGTARALAAILSLPFIRPPNCALTRYRRGTEGTWRADPPETPALLSLHP